MAPSKKAPSHKHNRDGRRSKNTTRIGRENVTTVEIYCTCGQWMATDTVKRERAD